MQRLIPMADPAERQRLEFAVKRLDALATLMDAAFLIPGTNIRMGLAGLAGIVPVVPFQVISFGKRGAWVRPHG